MEYGETDDRLVASTLQEGEHSTENGLRPRTMAE